MCSVCERRLKERSSAEPVDCVDKSERQASSNERVGAGAGVGRPAAGRIGKATNVEVRGVSYSCEHGSSYWGYLHL